MSDWVEQVIGGDLSLRGSTQYNYRRTLDRWIAPTVGRRPLKDIDASELRQFFGALLLGPAGKTAIYRLLSKAFRQAVNEGFVDGSPLAPIRRPHAGRKDVTPLTPEHVHALAEKVTPRYGLAILLAAYAGLRAGEVGGLRLQDIALDGSSLRIVQAVRREGGKRVLGDVKTTSGRRRVAIPTFLAEELRRHVQAFPGVVLASTSRWRHRPRRALATPRCTCLTSAFSERRGHTDVLRFVRDSSSGSAESVARCLAALRTDLLETFSDAHPILATCPEDQSG